jgi:membrane-associated phospholipid phosphatase
VILLARAGENGLLWHGLALAGAAVHPVERRVYWRALSRPYLGVHYPSDIVAGALLGHVTALAAP